MREVPAINLNEDHKKVSKCYYARITFGWFLTVINALILIFAIYITTQVSLRAKIASAVVVVLPLIMNQYLGYLILHPPHATVRFSIRRSFSKIINEIPLFSMLKPKIANTSVSLLYFGWAIYMNTAVDVEGMDAKSAAFIKQIAISLQLALFDELAMLRPLVMFAGDAIAYITLVAFGALCLYLFASVLSYFLMFAMRCAIMIVVQLIKWHWMNIVAKTTATKQN